MRHFTLLLFTLFSTCALAQTSIPCGDTFYDPGGEDADYPPNTDITYQLCPDAAGDAVTINFTLVDLEVCCDFIEVYNGSGTNNLLAEVSSPQSFTSSATDGCLTVVFTSDAFGQEAGFAAETSCTTAPTCPAPINLGRNGITTTTVEIFWQDIGPATVFDVFVALADEAPASNPDFQDVANNFTVTGLGPDTEYDLYVRADCDGPAGTDESTLTGPLRVTTAALPPLNDECMGSPPVEISTAGVCENQVAGTTNGATQSAEAFNCNSFDDLDVWYTFVPNTTSVQIQVTDTNPVGEDGITDFSVEVFSGSCGALQFESCDKRVTNLVPGQTYYLRIKAFRFAFFSLCVIDEPLPPVNDDCQDAVTLTVSPNVACNTSYSATTEGANQSMEASICGGTPDDDVWFSFTATGPNHLLNISNLMSTVGSTSGASVAYEVFSGDCDNLASLDCDFISVFDDPPVPIRGLGAGLDYFIRVYTINNPSQATFDICISSPPVNDECTGAIELPVNEDAECGLTVMASTIGATQSGLNCGSAFADDDVWYRFTATREKHLLIVSNLTGPGNPLSLNIQYELSEGNCGNATIIRCDVLTNTFAKELPDLTVGTEYTLRIFTRSDFNRATFDLCLASPPVNDDCGGAIVAAANPNLTNTLTTAGTTFGATRSFDISNGETDCSATANEDDVWYRFTALTDEHRVSLLNVVVRNFATEFGDDDDRGIVRLYSAADGCGAPVEVACGFLDGNADEEIFSGLTPGEDYFLSVQSFSFSNFLEFDLSIKTETLALPVQLISFTGRISDKINLLNWSVAREENFSHFELQRSANGINDWEVLGEIMGAAAGAADGWKSYAFEDSNPLTNAYYRLRSVDLGGSYELSTLVQLERSEVEGLSVYPNPNTGRFSLGLPAVDGPVDILLYDANGRKVAGGTATDELPVLSTGLYQVVVRNGSSEWVERVVVK